MLTPRVLFEDNSPYVLTQVENAEVFETLLQEHGVPYQEIPDGRSDACLSEGRRMIRVYSLSSDWRRAFRAVVDQMRDENSRNKSEEVTP